MTFVAGAESDSQTFDQQGVASTGQIVFGVLRHFNFENQLPIQFLNKRNVLGVFGESTFSFKNYAYLTVSGRQDWVSNLPKTTNHKFYPSVSGSFIPTDAFDGLKSADGKGLNYLKVRAGLGQSASFPGGYPTVGTVGQSTQVAGGFFGGSSGLVTNTVSNTQANPNLKPQTFK